MGSFFLTSGEPLGLTRAARDQHGSEGAEHAAVPRIQSQADPFHQVRKDDLGSISTPNAITLFVLSWSGE